MLLGCRFYLIAIVGHLAWLCSSQQFYAFTYQQAQQQYYYPQQQQQQFYYPQQFLPQQPYQPTIVYQAPQQPTYFVQQPQPQQVAQAAPQPAVSPPQQVPRAPPPQAQPPPPASRHSSAVKHQNVSPPASGSSIPKPQKPGYEFDLPPPPPSRFLPDDERAKILHRARLNRPTVQQKQQETFLVEESRPVQRIRHEHRRIETTQVTPRQVQVVRTMVTEPPPRPPPPPPLPPPVVVEPVERPVSHLSPTKNHPNKVFLDCCLAKNVDKACESRCNFDVISKKVLTGMFLGSDPCPQSYGLDLFTCAAQDADHRECCKRKNVQRTSAGEKCLAFCNMAPGSHFQADATYLPCWAVLNDVKTCFKEAILEVE